MPDSISRNLSLYPAPCFSILYNSYFYLLGSLILLWINLPRYVVAMRIFSPCSPTPLLVDRVLLGFTPFDCVPRNVTIPGFKPTCSGALPLPCPAKCRRSICLVALPLEVCRGPGSFPLQHNLPVWTLPSISHPPLPYAYGMS